MPKRWYLVECKQQSRNYEWETLFSLNSKFLSWAMSVKNREESKDAIKCLYLRVKFVEIECFVTSEAEYSQSICKRRNCSLFREGSPPSHSEGSESNASDVICMTSWLVNMNLSDGLEHTRCCNSDFPNVNTNFPGELKHIWHRNSNLLTRKCKLSRRTWTHMML